MHLTGQQAHDPEPNGPAPAHLSGRVVVLVSGLPEVGKSVLVDALAPRLGAAVASRDAARIGSTLRVSGFGAPSSRRLRVGTKCRPSACRSTPQRRPTSLPTRRSA